MKQATVPTLYVKTFHSGFRAAVVRVMLTSLFSLWGR